LSYAAKSLALRISTAALTRLPLADAVSGGEANTKQEQKSDWFHDTSPNFHKRQTSTRRTSGSGLPEKRKISGGGM
jgi:hypothetical protein